MSWPSWVKDRALDNLAYKIVALFVTLILWLTMLGRKEVVTDFDLHIQLLTSSTQVLAGELFDDKARVRVVGPVEAARRFHQTEDSLVVDLSRLGYGLHSVRLGKEGLNLPMGLRVISIEPEEIDVRIEAKLDGE